MEVSFEMLGVAAFIFFFAAFIHGSIGFGFPMIATPLLALVTDIQTAIIITLIPTLLVNFVSIASEGNILHALRSHLSLGLLAMAGSGIGTLLLIFTNAQIFEALLAIAIITYLILEKRNKNFSWIREHPRSSKFIFGVSAGVLGGLTNVMAPVLIIYSLESRYSKREIIQASNFCFLFGKLIQLVLFSTYGKFNLNELSISSVMIFVVTLALYFGIKIKEKINASLFKRVLRIFLLVLAVTLFAKVAGNTGLTII